MRLRAGALVLPAALLVLAAFIGPLAYLLSLAVRSPEMAAVLPRTTALLLVSPSVPPPEAVYAALAQELRRAEAEQALGPVASRLNFEAIGLRSLLLRTARAPLDAPYASSMPALDPRWADPALWQMIRDASQPVTPTYLLRALDLRRTADGIGAIEPDRAVFLAMFGRTFVIAASTTGLCLLLAYPVAFTLTRLSRRWARLAMAFVLIPFWTSIIVRSIAWVILLQKTGPLNAALLALGLVDAPLTLIFTRFAVLLAMVHVLLPFAVMPLFSVMRGIDPALLDAAAALGAPPRRAFLRVYLPLTMPGVGGAALMVFMLAVGFYVTPALVGGPGDQMVASFIAFYTGVSINWGMAAALATLLLGGALAVVALARRVAPGPAPIR